MSRHDHNPTYKATAQSKTAQYANPRHSSPTKRERRLNRRFRDYASVALKSGYHTPGSLQ